MLKGRVSLNDLRYRKCFGLRATKFERPICDFDDSKEEERKSSNNTRENSSALSHQHNKIVQAFWLRSKSTIADWIQNIDALQQKINENQSKNSSNSTDYWK